MPFPDLLPGETHWLAARAGWLVAVGLLGWALSGAVPPPSVWRLRTLAPGRGTVRWRTAARHRAGELRERAGAWFDAVSGRGRGRRQRAVVELCRILAAELRAGRTPAEALASSVSRIDPVVAAEFAPLANVAWPGEDLTLTLGTMAHRSGSAGLGYLAACWRVSSDTGAGLAGVVERLADSLARDEAQRREFSAQLAGPRSTALLLSVLPGAGVVMAALVGASPVAFLFTTPAGWGCLLGGAALNVAGVCWINRMARRALTAVDPG
ncbi:tight adherence protein B [Haloactinospora alba]|uniref:Tight adherence protein B n=1 Tax=Haloactinospora alba TaxID=405555 RepID=A0A543NA64_9ACTN|nr:type II secretion system F family protein [Haloactinospora alba]TQN28709.1 tight adherence protein B [Haloactinospora alba]